MDIILISIIEFRIFGSKFIILYSSVSGKRIFQLLDEKHVLSQTVKADSGY